MRMTLIERDVTCKGFSHPLVVRRLYDTRIWRYARLLYLLDIDEINTGCSVLLVLIKYQRQGGSECLVASPKFFPTSFADKTPVT